MKNSKMREGVGGQSPFGHPYWGWQSPLIRKKHPHLSLWSVPPPTALQMSQGNNLLCCRTCRWATSTLCVSRILGSTSPSWSPRSQSRQNPATKPSSSTGIKQLLRAFKNKLYRIYRDICIYRALYNVSQEIYRSEEECPLNFKPLHYAKVVMGRCQW